jgi:glycosyltransferase involved in cell wall biosynthesis
MDAIRRSHLGEIEAQPEEMRGIFEQIFLGFLDYPVHTLLDVYLRPSVAEAFGLGTVEAYLCGVPVLASDRDGCGELVLPEHQVHLASDIDLRGHYHDYADPAYRAAVSKAADDLFAMLSAPSTWQVPGRELRSRMIASGYTTDSMLLRYNRLLTDLLRREGEEDVSL